MNARWDAELETATTRVPGYRSRSQSDSEPQPQPRSSTSIPSTIPARSQVSSSMASSASSSVVTPAGQKQELYLRRRPEHEPEELGWHLVVLLVRLLRNQGDRLRARCPDEILDGVTLTGLRPQPPGAVHADRRSNQRVGEEMALEEGVGDSAHPVTCRRGGSGTNTLVVRWYSS